MNKEMIGGCCVCSDDRGWSENPLVYCDGQNCNVAVHQACYGIVTVPTGPWFCRKCESQERSSKVKCELCPSKYGALKRTDNNGWAHVVCALYIPEVRFGNVTTMEPIQLQLIPSERFNKVCYICEEKGKNSSSTAGACMQCNKVGCKYQFHVTCAQSLGLLCEEAGNYLDNVKYCGYCQHHYSKLRKGGNVKTIPPYKPESHNSDSNSEKEGDSTTPVKKESPSPVPGRPGRKTGSGNKSSTTSSRSGSTGKSGSQPTKSVQNNKGSSEKGRTTPRGAKPEDLPPPSETSTPEKSDSASKKDSKNSETPESDKDSSKDSARAKKRKVSSNSRTPTPVQSEVSVVVSTAGGSFASGGTGSSTVSNSNKADSSSTTTGGSANKKGGGAVHDSKKAGGGSSGSTGGESTPEKGAKTKSKVETTQSIISNQPIVALTSISTTQNSVTAASKFASPVISSIEVTQASEVSTSVVTSAPSIIQVAQAQKQDQLGSLVVSVPLASTSLNPHNPILSNQTSVLAVTPFSNQPDKSQRSAGVATSGPIPQEESAQIENESMMLTTVSTDSGVLTHSEMSGGGLKITYEKQADTRTEMDMELEMDTPMTESETPSKRGRSQSIEKVERFTRGNKKRNNTSNSMPPSALAQSATMPKRNSRSQNSSPPSTPQIQQQHQQQQQPGAFAAISQSQIKDSPPSSPSSESQDAPPTSRVRARNRKSAPAAVPSHSASSRDGTPSGSKDNKDIKLFQNGVTTAPHMLGNQLNPNSTMHQKMTEHLGDEINAHSIYHNSTESGPLLVGPQMHHKIVQSARASSTSSTSTASGGSGLSSILGGGGAGGTIPQTLDQLLERQWEQGSQFLMEQAQHFDIASLLSCLHQLRAENTRLEEHVSSLLQRRDHLLAVNARLAIPLTSQPPPAAPQPPHPHTVNNIHQSLSHGDIPRPSRHHSGTGYDRHSQSSGGGGSQYPPMENGLPPDVYPQNPHRSRSPGVGNSGQPSPNISRHHSPAGSYPNNGLIRQSQDSGGLLRQSADTGGRAAPSRPAYNLYDRPGSSHSQHSQQMVISRRDWDTELHHHGNKPS